MANRKELKAELKKRGYRGVCKTFYMDNLPIDVWSVKRISDGMLIMSSMSPCMVLRQLESFERVK